MEPTNIWAELCLKLTERETLRHLQTLLILPVETLLIRPDLRSSWTNSEWTWAFRAGSKRTAVYGRVRLIYSTSQNKNFVVRTQSLCFLSSLEVRMVTELKHEEFSFCLRKKRNKCKLFGFPVSQRCRRCLDERLQWFTATAARVGAHFETRGRTKSFGFLNRSLFLRLCAASPSLLVLTPLHFSGTTLASVSHSDLPSEGTKHTS